MAVPSASPVAMPSSERWAKQEARRAEGATGTDKRRGGPKGLTGTDKRRGGPKGLTGTDKRRGGPKGPTGTEEREGETYGRASAQRRQEVVRRGGRDQGRRPRHQVGRVHRLRRTVRLRQVHLASPGRRARGHQRRHADDRWRRGQ